MSIECKVLSQLLQKLKFEIKSIYIFGTNGQEVIFITNDDKVYGFGDNSSGVLGFGHSNVVLKPKIIEELSQKQLIKIDWKSGKVFGLTKLGELYHWASTTDNYRSYCCPQTVDLFKSIRVSDISCGNEKTLVLTKSSELYIASNLNNDINHILIDEKVIAISSGNNHFFAVTKSKCLFGWGDNSYGQLGLSSNKPNISLTKLKRIDLFDGIVGKVSCGQNHTLVLTINGDVYSFGSNCSGQLGIGCRSYESLPKLINNSVKLIDIFANSNANQSMALSESNFVYIWGDCKDISAERPLKSRFNSFQDSINYYSKHVFTPELINYNKLFGILNESIDGNEILKVIAEAFNDSNTCDLKFKIKDNEKFKYIYIYKWFVIKRSKYFETMFANEWSESTSDEIEIKSHSFDAYYAFIRFLYTDSIDTKDIAVLTELLDIANESLNEELKGKSCNTIEALITVENVCDFYSAAIKYNCSQLENYCFDFMSFSMKAIMKTNAYKQMDLILVQRFTERYFA